MGNTQTKNTKTHSYRYNIHGLQYLEESPKHKKKASKGRKSKGNKHDSSDDVDEFDGFKSNLNSSTKQSRQRNNSSALYVSSDWTTDIEAVADVDWLHCSDYPYESIVMSGGGSKGYAFIGALKALEDCGVLAGIKRVAGSSAGAICAGLIAVGCTPQDIADVFKGDIKWLFQDQKCAGCCCLPKIFANYGVHPGQRFLRIYGQVIASKTGNPDITFGQLYETYGRELCVAVTNLSKMCSEYCSYQNTPDLSIRTAVRMSMSFPMVYEAVKMEVNGQTSLYTDGGTLDQFPVHCFDDKRPDLNHNTKYTSAIEKVNEKTLGIYVVSESAIDYKIWNALFGCKIPYKPTYMPDTKLARARLQVEFEKRRRKNRDYTMKDFMEELSVFEKNHDDPMFHYETCDRSSVDIRNFKDYFVTTIETLLISQRKLHIKPDDARRTVAVNCGYVGTNDYVLESGDREFMLRQGYEHTQQFLKEYIMKKSRGEMRLDASLTSQTIHEERERHFESHMMRSENLGTSLPSDVLAVTAVNLTQSSIQFMDDTLDEQTITREGYLVPYKPGALHDVHSSNMVGDSQVVSMQPNPAVQVNSRSRQQRRKERIAATQSKRGDQIRESSQPKFGPAPPLPTIEISSEGRDEVDGGRQMSNTVERPMTEDRGSKENLDVPAWKNEAKSADKIVGELQNYIRNSASCIPLLPDDSETVQCTQEEEKRAHEVVKNKSKHHGETGAKRLSQSVMSTNGDKQSHLQTSNAHNSAQQSQQHQQQKQQQQQQLKSSPLLDHSSNLLQNKHKHTNGSVECVTSLKGSKWSLTSQETSLFHCQDINMNPSISMTTAITTTDNFPASEPFEVVTASKPSRYDIEGPVRYAKSQTSVSSSTYENKTGSQSSLLNDSKQSIPHIQNGAGSCDDIDENKNSQHSPDSVTTVNVSMRQSSGSFSKTTPAKSNSTGRLKRSSQLSLAECRTDGSDKFSFLSTPSNVNKSGAPKSTGKHGRDASEHKGKGHGHSKDGHHKAGHLKKGHSLPNGFKSHDKRSKMSHDTHPIKPHHRDDKSAAVSKVQNSNGIPAVETTV